jgi:hypothetical protein
MVLHPRDARMLNDLHRQEIRDFVTGQRLADLVAGQSRGAGSRPTRLPRVVLVVTVFIAALLALTAQHVASGAAQADTPAAISGESFVGAWRFTDLGFDLPSLATLTADGNVLVSNLPVEAVPPELDVEMLLLSGGHGVWEAAGEDRATFTFVYLYVDETGTFQSSATLSGALELTDDAQSLSGEYGFEVHEPEGAVVHSYTGAIEGARIGIVPMAEIAATVGTPASLRRLRPQRSAELRSLLLKAALRDHAGGCTPCGRLRLCPRSQGLGDGLRERQRAPSLPRRGKWPLS